MYWFPQFTKKKLKPRKDQKFIQPKLARRVKRTKGQLTITLNENYETINWDIASKIIPQPHQKIITFLCKNKSLQEGKWKFNVPWMANKGQTYNLASKFLTRKTNKSFQ